MKKVLFLLVLTSAFGCNSNETESTSKDSTTATSSDSAQTVQTAVMTPPCGTINVSDYVIDGTTRKKIKDHVTGCPVLSRRLPQYESEIPCVRDAILKAHPGATIQWEYVRYKDAEDEKRYCKNHGYPYPDPRGEVKNVRAKLYYVNVTKADKSLATIYYDFTTICPPPYDDDGNCPDPALKNDSTKVDTTKK